MGFEPTKHMQAILSRSPLTAREHYLNPNGFVTSCGTRTHNPQIRSLMRYPIAPIGHLSFTIGLMLEGGFEPPKRKASDLKSLPFDQTREP